jgi:hypothetical protein
MVYLARWNPILQLPKTNLRNNSSTIFFVKWEGKGREDENREEDKKNAVDICPTE